MSPCLVPFNNVGIHPDGSVYTCCPPWVKWHSIGNIYENNFEDIWYSEKAKELRRKLINNDYSFCERSICSSFSECDVKGLNEIADYPKYVSFCHDHECNYQCITCRDETRFHTDEHLEFLNGKIETVFLPMLNNAEKVYLSGSGDPFASRHCRELIKAIVKAYPNIKFNLHTNGSLLNEKNCKDLGILDKISEVDISIHATNPETYKQITVNGNFDKIYENIHWISELKRIGTVNKVTLSFVVHKLNYQEMPDFLKLAEKLDVIASFWGYRDWNTAFGKKYKEMAIFDEFHPEYKNFHDIIAQDIFKSPNCSLNPHFKELSQKKYVRKILL